MYLREQEVGGEGAKPSSQSRSSALVRLGGQENKMETIPLQFLLYMSKLFNQLSPALVMTDHDVIPTHFCSGAYFPAACIQYGLSDVSSTAETLLDQSKSVREINLIFLSDDDQNYHGELIKTLSFTHTRVYVMPLKYVHLTPLRLDSNILFYNRTSPNNYTVFESYSIKGGHPITSELFKWPDKESLRRVPFIERRTLNGATLNIAWHNNATDEVGLNAEILRDLQAQLNFNVEIIPVRSKSWGGKMKNGTWFGLVAMLKTGLIDLTLGRPSTSMMITLERRDVIDYLCPYEHSKTTLLSAKSSKPRLDVWAYINIFPLPTWIIGFGTIFVFGICFSVSSNETVSQGMTLMLRLFLQLGYEIPVRRFATKVMLIVAALSLMMLYLYYTADLTATMTSESKSLNIKSLSDVEEQGYKVLTMPPGTVSYEIFAHARNDSIFTRLRENKVLEAVARGDELEIMKADSKALFYGPQNLKLKTQGIVDLDIDEAVIFYKAIAVQKGSELFTALNHRIQMMIESGIINRLKQKWRGEHDSKYGMEEAIELGYEHVLFPFASLAVGIILALPMLMGEICLKIARKWG